MSVIRLIREIKAGTLRGRMLAPADRQRCVEHLGIEGMSNPEIAEILGVSERTVIRDRIAIKQANALQHDPELTAQTAGRLVRSSEVVVNKLRRISRDPATPANVRVDAELGIWKTEQELAQSLQELGFVQGAAGDGPLGAPGEALDAPPIKDTLAELKRIQALAKERGVRAPVVRQGMKELRGTLEKLAAREQVDAFAEAVQSQEPDP